MPPRISLLVGDITQQDADAIVNAANSSLVGGGGVDGAIHRRGGPAILEECRRIRETRWPDGLPTGRAVATTGGRLRARWVIHTVGPVYSATQARSGLLASCHVESLRAADEIRAPGVAVSAISTAVYGYPLDEDTAVALGATRSADKQVHEGRIVRVDQMAYEAFARALASFRGQ